MAPWPELENAQQDPDNYIEGATTQQSTTAAKEKETNESKCRSCGPRLALRGDPQETQAWFLIPLGLCCLLVQMTPGPL